MKTVNHKLQSSRLYIPLMLKLTWMKYVLTRKSERSSRCFLSKKASWVSTLYLDGFQWMGDSEQNSVRVDDQVDRHIPGNGRLRGGKQEVNGGVSWEPGTFLCYSEKKIRRKLILHFSEFQRLRERKRKNQQCQISQKLRRTSDKFTWWCRKYEASSR